MISPVFTLVGIAGRYDKLSHNHSPHKSVAAGKNSAGQKGAERRPNPFESIRLSRVRRFAFEQFIKFSRIQSGRFNQSKCSGINISFRP